MNRFAALIFLLLSTAAHAQQRGNGEVAFQGYYLGGGSQRLSDTSGVAARFEYMLPRIGFLSGSMEGYGSQGKVRTGDNFLQLKGVPWAGQYWTFTGGDFRMPASLVEFPFYNVFLPEIMGRGFRVEAAHGGRQYTVFYGAETLLTGPRVPFRIQAPQTMMGASARFRGGRRWQFGLRLLRLSARPDDTTQNGFFVTRGRDFRRLDTASAQSLYSLTRYFKLYAEASRALAEQRDGQAGGREQPNSAMAGAAFDTARVTVRANYAYQGVRYFPLAGYFAGDRQGPYAEMRVRPFTRLELFGSAYRYANNLERNPETATYRSSGNSAGAALTLPWKFAANAQLSNIRFIAWSPEVEAGRLSLNRQVTGSLARSFRRHTVRFGVRELRMAMPGRVQRQNTREIEDFVSFGRFFVGGAARLQRSVAEDRRNTLFFRGSGQARFGAFTLYANVESGNDLVNRTVFATSAYNSTSLGMTARLGRDWDLQVDAFQNRLVQDLNPESVFLLETRGIGLSGVLSRFNQWSLFFRVVRRFRWGAEVPPDAALQLANQRAPLIGVVEGFVHEISMAARRPAPGIPVSLDEVRSTTTDAEGRFRFSDVPEGMHRVLLASRDMPAEFDPGDTQTATVVVRPRHTSRAELDVAPLTLLRGTVAGPPKVPLEGIVIRLLPTRRYTTTGEDGAFAFYNLREGDYQVAVDTTSLPPGAVLLTEPSVPAAARAGVEAAPVKFGFRIESNEKPVRRVVLQD